MNTLTTIRHSNACPPAYRGLTPKEECRLRSVLTGIEERPGRRPPSPDDKKGITTTEIEKRRVQILRLLADEGPLRARDIYRAIVVSPQIAHCTLSAMTVEGLLEYRKEAKRPPIWALAGVAQ